MKQTQPIIILQIVRMLLFRLPFLAAQTLNFQQAQTPPTSTSTCQVGRMYLSEFTIHAQYVRLAHHSTLRHSSQRSKKTPGSRSLAARSQTTTGKQNEKSYRPPYLSSVRSIRQDWLPDVICLILVKQCYHHSRAWQLIQLSTALCKRAGKYSKSLTPNTSALAHRVTCMNAAENHLRNDLLAGDWFMTDATMYHSAHVICRDQAN